MSVKSSKLRNTSQKSTPFHSPLQTRPQGAPRLPASEKRARAPLANDPHSETVLLDLQHGVDPEEDEPEPAEGLRRVLQDLEPPRQSLQPSE